MTNNKQEALEASYPCVKKGINITKMDDILQPSSPQRQLTMKEKYVYKHKNIDIRVPYNASKASK